ncbi:helix-turn-helix transcriptional regulator [Tepidibacter mesophilus]|uniref:helix-turn-helix transcriptional regulator n=1 Tax=Tepidibacter mesophilus TaxID=655607 RepID=UPI001FA88808|nr:WYL domain-containing protein [Tepidibacter mesophilus]
MIRYLNNLNEFNLKDIMTKYNISKSTALRDIQSLEELGMPIYADYGRYGKYSILKNKLLSPIVFNMDEVFTLYFAMQTINDYQSTPFHIQMENLNEKFERCLSINQQEKINQMKNVLQFQSHPHHNICLYLDKILISILNEEVSNITYDKNGTSKKYIVKFFNISAKFGQWYANGYIVKEDQFKVFRCDKIQNIIKYELICKHSVDELKQKFQYSFNLEHRIIYEIEITERGKDLFYKEHYPNMELIIGDKNYIRGHYSKLETDFITNYFIGYGNSIVSIKPTQLKEIIIDKISELTDYYNYSL